MCVAAYRFWNCTQGFTLEYVKKQFSCLRYVSLTYALKSLTHLEVTKITHVSRPNTGKNVVDVVNVPKCGIKGRRGLQKRIRKVCSDAIKKLLPASNAVCVRFVSYVSRNERRRYIVVYE